MDCRTEGIGTDLRVFLFGGGDTGSVKEVKYFDILFYDGRMIWTVLKSEKNKPDTAFCSIRLLTIRNPITLLPTRRTGCYTAGNKIPVFEAVPDDCPAR